MLCGMYNVISFLRGWSIFTIVLMHLLMCYDITGVAKSAISLGGAGVHVFILCSGYGLYLSYLRKPLSYFSFLKRRFGKIYMPYAVVVILTVVWALFKHNSVSLLEVCSHLFLFKMFDGQLDISIGYRFWFISTIIQFYLLWPVWVKLAQTKKPVYISLAIIVVWWIFVYAIDKENNRAWGSSCLQYLWEFVLGMHIAKIYAEAPERVKIPSLPVLGVCCVVGLSLSAVLALSGDKFKLFNDIPSLVGYLSLALFIYKLNIPKLNGIFEYTSGVGYEWYLVHSLVFGIAALMSIDVTILDIIFRFGLSYMIAVGYNRILKFISRCA